MQGKYPLRYIKLFVFYHWTKITHKNENRGLFVFPRVENRFSEPNFRWFFFFEVKYLLNHRSDFDDFFCKVMTIQFSFQIKKETVRKIETFEKELKFRIFDRFRFLSSLIRNFFRLWFFRLKRLWNCQQFAKNIIEIEPTVPEISCFEIKVSSKLGNFF